MEELSVNYGGQIVLREVKYESLDYVHKTSITMDENWVESDVQISCRLVKIESFEMDGYD